MSDQPIPSTPDRGLEADPRFPSGEWTGFFLQAVIKGRHWMELHLTFGKGILTGEGRDWVGEFLMKGRYQVEDGSCWWTKSYIGKHSIYYKGYNEGKGIWGIWEWEPPWKGGFHIWPIGMADPTQARLSAEAEIPSEVEVESNVKELEPVGLS